VNPTMDDALAVRLRSAVENIPFNALLGVRVRDFSPGVSTAVLPASRQLENHRGGVHAVAEFAVADAASGAALLTRFHDLLSDTVTPVARGARIRYLAPARGEVTARAVVAREVAGAARVELASTGRADVDVPATLTDEDGSAVAEVVVEWSLSADPDGPGPERPSGAGTGG
jgi:acyl-coenzyme A thioesterase PaaI-like protein